MLPHAALDANAAATMFRDALASKDQHYFCATMSSRVVGFCSCSFKHSLWSQARLAHIDELVVGTAFRGQGIGRRLVEYAEQVAAACGCNRIELDSAYRRKDAHAFYSHMGYEDRACLFSKALKSTPK